MAIQTQPPQLPQSDTTTTPTTTKSNFSISIQCSKFSMFSRWRPSFHLLAAHGWLNDPCAPGYDPATGQYHLAFQWNPKGNDWGDISWGRAVSYDLISWEVDSEPSLVPSAPYDCKGIFTGCLQPTNINGQEDGTLACFYTSVSQLPIHYTLPYATACETLSIALSHNAGRTWERYHGNPILGGPPANLHVTGWRDPYICAWPSASHVVMNSHGESGKDAMYGLISGGLAGQTPTVFVYAVERSAMENWKYVGTLLDVGLNFSPSRWSGDFGVNWEVSNLVTLKDDEGVSRDFIIMGVEGCIPQENSKQPTARDRRIQRSQLWMCIRENDQPSSSTSALMQYGFGGIFDSGLFYAANSFWDPVIRQQILFGWITEEDLSDELRREQGWSGMISLPRVLHVQAIHRVKRARSTVSLSDITSIEASPDRFGSYTVRTLGVTLDPRVTKLREGARVNTRSDLNLGVDVDAQFKGSVVPLSTDRWEVEAEISVGRNCQRVGLEIYHGPDPRHKSALFWDPISETFQIDRPGIDDAEPSSARTNHAPETSPHTLFIFTYAQSSQGESAEACDNLPAAEAEVEETLRIRAVFDTSVLEVFVNERTAISTRIYLVGETYSATACAALRFFAEPVHDNKGELSAPARLLHATIWDGLACK
ncbi:glycoside hydrolase family 32 protein [Aspergillus lucknowensis]|uniref:Glycosyl hydrolase n=1 Tax=Aspergillus lucknowensis TaxID=176173 RepID=A0ABR4LL17_9EURO